MLHPQTEIGAVSPDIGVGVFARAFIPKGTIVYIKDPLEISIADDDPRLAHPETAIPTLMSRSGNRSRNAPVLLDPTESLLTTTTRSGSCPGPPRGRPRTTGMPRARTRSPCSLPNRYRGRGA